MTIRLFGHPRFESDGAFFPTKGFILVAALLLAPRQTLTRLEAACLLWENLDQKRALANLRQLLLRVQRFSDGEQLVVASNNELSAGPLACRSDLGKFLKALNSEDVAVRTEGVFCVDGELLQACESSHEHFYLWLSSERSRLKDQFFSIVDRLVEEMTRFNSHRPDQFDAVAERAVALEPDREATYRTIMAGYARIGDSSGVDRISRKLKRMLSLEARSPEPATLALQRRILAEQSQIGSEERAVSQNGKMRVAFMMPRDLDDIPAPPLVRSFVEDVANGLARFRTFIVLSPHSTYAASVNADARSQSALQAGYIVKTVVFPDGRASVSLVADRTGEIIWSLDLSIERSELPSAFRMLSRQVVAGLADALERRQLEIPRKVDASAYFHLLSGQHMLRGKCDLPFLRRARAEFRKALDIEHGLAVARGRIAQTLQLEWLMLGGNDPHLLHRAKAEAEASIAIDGACGIGHWMGAVIALHQRDFDNSAERFLEAESLAPNSADLLLQHADALAHFGQADQAWERFGRAIDLNPFAPDIYWWAGASIALKREDYGTAIELCARMENDEPAIRVLTISHAMGGDLETARRYGLRVQENHPGMTARQISQLSPDRNPEATEKLFQAYRLAGIK